MAAGEVVFEAGKQASRKSENVENRRKDIINLCVLSLFTNRDVI
jgi:hypothetical protein